MVERCSKCILPASTPNISFDKNGICNFCLEYKPMQVYGEEEFLKVIEPFQTKSKHNKYDSMIAVSGGRDSTYLMWKLVKDYNMRPLIVHYANPFTSQQAKINLENALNILNLDCVRWGFKEGYHINETKNALQAWSYNPSHSMLPIICAVCKGWWPDFFRIATENQISLIVIGSNPLETAGFKKKSFGGARDYHKISRLPKTITKGLYELMHNPTYLYKCSWKAIIKGFLCASHSSPYIRTRYKSIKVVRLFDYIRWDEKVIMSTIKENLGWEKAPEHPSPWRFDCKLDHVRKFLYLNIIGVSEYMDLLSKMIRENIITRDEAMERMRTENETPVELVAEVLDIMGLKIDKLNWPLEWTLPKN